MMTLKMLNFQWKTLNYLQCYESHRGEKKRNLELKYTWKYFAKHCRTLHYELEAF